MIQVGVVAAMREEVAPLVRRALAPRHFELAGRDGHHCLFGENRGIVFVTGDGPRRAADGVRAFLDRFDFDAVLAVGVAGGLTRDLQPATVLASREVVGDSTPVAAPDPAWLAIATGHEGVVAGTLVTVPRIITTLDGKATLRRELGREPAAVDLESAIYAAAIAERGLPYLVLRAIQDTADEALPPFLEECAREDGSIDRRRVVRSALEHPTRVASLAKMSVRLRTCSRRLCVPAEAVLSHDRSSRSLGWR